MASSVNHPQTAALLALANQQKSLNGVSPSSPHRYFTNISIGGRDYSFNSDGYLSNPLLDVISYINGRGWEEVSAPSCLMAFLPPVLTCQ